MVAADPESMWHMRIFNPILVENEYTSYSTVVLKDTIDHRVQEYMSNKLKLGVAFTEIGNNFVYLRGLHFPASFLYMYQI